MIYLETTDLFSNTRGEYLMSLPGREGYQHERASARYVVDAENTAEMARLIRQARLVTERMGLLPQEIKLADHATILDIGCGPGEWVLTLATVMPQARITGIDISKSMIAYAQEMALEQQALRVTFEVMDACKPLAFPDASFDVVHLRFVNAFLSTTLWPALLTEIRRILRPGGSLVSLEAEGLGISNSVSLTEYNRLMVSAMRQLGQCFVPSPQGTGITAMQAPLLREAGFFIKGSHALSIDYSSGAPDHEAVVDDWTVLLKLLQPLLVAMQLASQEELDTLYARTQEEMRSPYFRALGTAHQVWAMCPFLERHREDQTQITQARPVEAEPIGTAEVGGLP